MAGSLYKYAVIKVKPKSTAAETSCEHVGGIALRWQTRRRTFWLGCIKIEANKGSVTKQEVETYIRSLEYEFSQGIEHTPEFSDKEYRGKAANKDRPSNSSTFLWGLVAITAGCFWWLARIILKALS